VSDDDDRFGEWMMTIPIPLVGSALVQIVGAFPISEAAWDQLMRVLDAMKPGLVAEAPEPVSVSVSSASFEGRR
jgi:hypothetical protein